MATKVKARPKRKPGPSKPRAAAPERGCKSFTQPQPAPIAPRRRKLVQWKTGEVYVDQHGEPITWPTDDPEAEAALMAKAKAGGGWALVPSEYRFADMGPAGKVWR